MRKIISIVLFAALNLIFLTGAFAQEDLTELGKQFVPEGMQFAHRVVSGKFAETASGDTSGRVVVLYRKETPGGGYEGLVLVPQGFEAFDRYQLPEPEFVWAMMTPVSVFFDNADVDPENELFIIDESYTGVGPDGAKAFYRTRVYDWNGNGFTHLEELSERIGDPATAGKVRQKLKTLRQTAVRKIDVTEYNRRIERATTAGDDWVRRPLLVIGRMIEPFAEMKSRDIRIESPFADATETLTVTVIDDGYADDSVRGKKYTFKLEINEAGVWQFVSAEDSQRCWKGRGHQDYSALPCS
jgi:hypothetical protein